MYTNFFSATVVTAITPWDWSTDTQIILDKVPLDQTWYLVIEPHVTNKREIVYFYKVDWNTVYVKANKRWLRWSATVWAWVTHWAGAIVNQNLTAQNMADFEKSTAILKAWLIERAQWLDVLVNAWTWQIWYRDVSINETTISLDNNKTYYFEIKPNDTEWNNAWEIVYTEQAIESEDNWNKHYKKLAIVRTVSWDINEIDWITDRREFGNIANYEFVKSLTTDTGSALQITPNLTTREIDVQISTDDITTEEVSNVLQVKDLWISTDKLADVAVNNSKLADNSVSTSKIQDSAVTNIKINDSAITDSKIRSWAVTWTKIPSSTISSTHIQDWSITEAKIANAAVTSSKINTSSINKNHIQSWQVVKWLHAVWQSALTDDVVLSWTWWVSLSQNWNIILIDWANLANVLAKADIDYITPTDWQTDFTLTDNITATKWIRVRLNWVMKKTPDDWEASVNSLTWKNNEETLDTYDELWIEWFSTSDLAWASYDWIEDVFTPTNLQTDFTLTNVPEDIDSILFYVNDMPYTQNDDWTINWLTVTWLDNWFTLASTDEVKIRYVILA